jgi:hypothetical protein
MGHQPKYEQYDKQMKTDTACSRFLFGRHRRYRCHLGCSQSGRPRGPSQTGGVAVHAIYDRDEFRPRRFQAEWLPDSSGYTVMELAPVRMLMARYLIEHLPPGPR